MDQKEIVELKIKNEKISVKNSWESGITKNDIKNDFKNQINNEKIEDKKSEKVTEIPIEKIDKKLVFDSWANDSYNIKNAKNNNVESYKTDINTNDSDSNRNLNDFDDKNGQYSRNNNKSDNNNNDNKNNDNNSKFNYNYNDNLSPERGTFSLTSMEHSNTPASPISPRASDVIPNNKNYISQKNREGKENQNDVRNNIKNKNENDNDNDNENKSKFSNDNEKKDSNLNIKIAENDEKKEKFDQFESKNNFENSKGTSSSVKKGKKEFSLFFLLISFVPSSFASLIQIVHLTFFLLTLLLLQECSRE